MGNPLQDRRTPQDLAANGQIIEIAEKIGDLERLAGIIETDLDALDPDKLPAEWQSSVVTGRLEFGFADAHKRVAVLDGHLEATIDAVCQRCLEPFQMPLVIELRWKFGGDNAAAVDDGYENWELAEDTLRPLDVVEEALIMAMPFTAMHDDDPHCTKPDVAVQAGTGKTQPFATLKSQMEDDAQ